MNKLLAALIVAAFASTGAVAMEAKKVGDKPEAAPAAASAPKAAAKADAKKDDKKVEVKKEEAKK